MQAVDLHMVNSFHVSKRTKIPSMYNFGIPGRLKKQIITSWLLSGPTVKRLLYHQEVAEFRVQIPTMPREQNWLWSLRGKDVINLSPVNQSKTNQL